MLLNYLRMVRQKKPIYIETVGGYSEPWYFDLCEEEVIIGNKKTLNRYFVCYDGEGEISKAESVSGGGQILFVPFKEIMPFYLETTTPPPEEKPDLERWKAIREFVWKHWDYADEEIYDIITAFIHATWLPDQWKARPFFAALGDTGVGKSRLMNMFSLLCYRADTETSLGDANLFRGLQMYKPTLILDETEYMTNEERQILINILNAAQKDGTYVKRMKTQADENIWLFDWFKLKAFVCLAGTKVWHETLQRRSILVYPQENTRPVALKVDTETGRKLRAQLLAWRIKHVTHPPFKEEEIIKLCMDNGIVGTSYELFYPLVAVAPNPEIRKKIVEFAKRHKKRAKEIRSISDSANVFYAIYTMSTVAQRVDTSLVILLKDLMAELNKDTPERQWFTVKSVGSIVRALGFEMKHTRYGSAIIWDEKLAERLRKQYDIKKIDLNGETEETPPSPDWLRGDAVTDVKPE